MIFYLRVWWKGRYTLWGSMFQTFGGHRASSTRLLCKTLKIAEKEGFYD